MNDRELDQILDQIVDEEQRPEREAPGFLQWAVVDAVNVGPPASLDITLAGASIPGVRYDAAYTPTVGDIVRCTLGPDVFVLGTPA